ncbi:MAG TPA: S16 family serine protease, partial [Candidatus Thermoplasmatota archaeon]|nr:S16 family serine protease [Candidatus Thermoplasmatota archaeon]
MRRLPVALVLLLLLAPLAPAKTLDLGSPVVLRGAAVAETPQGLVGSTATFTVTAATNGSGHVFLDTFPLTQVDMQGSARLAARVAAQATGKDLSQHDVFFVIRSGSVQIGGPSAGAVLAVGAIAALNGWQVRPDVLMTGTISPDGTVGPVGGVAEKARAAAEAGMTTFLFPAGEEVVPLSTEGNRRIDLRAYCRDELRIRCLPVADVYEAVENMTDHAFVRPPLVGNVTGERFRERLGPLSNDLLDAARARLAEARAEVGQVPPGEARAALEARLAEAQSRLAAAESASGNGTHYTAASLSFQASIAARDARDRARVAGAANPAQALQEAIAQAATDVRAARDEVEDARVRDSSAFEFVAAAQVRLLDAEETLQRAREQATTDPGAAVGSAAFAGERAATARWWLRLGGDVAPGAPVDPEGLAEAARDAMTTSAEEIAYVDAVLASARTPAGPVLDAARARLADAERAMERGFHPAAMLHAMEAQVRAS